MDLLIFTEPQQGATYDQLLTVARRAEALGFAGFFRSDHYLKMGDVDGAPGPTDAWTTLAGLARDTERLRLGTLMTAATFRRPGPLAVTVAQVDQMSGGRVELGIGAGWYEEEHRAFGIPFPDTKERFDRLEEQLEIVTGLLGTEAGRPYAFDGRYYQLTESPVRFTTVQRPVPVLVGGFGPRRTPRLAARYATEFNLPFAQIPDFEAQRDRVIAACEAQDRDPATLACSVAQVVACGRDEAEFTRRAGAIGRAPDELRQHGVAGTVPEVVEALGRWRETGASRCYLQVLDLADLEHLDLLAEAVLPQLG